ANSRVPTSII
nr:Chain C, V-iCAL36 peptide [synthetic construct]4JOG_D Chain D, V-iCAL36 peptide [synthetic construct]